MHYSDNICTGCVSPVYHLHTYTHRFDVAQKILACGLSCDLMNAEVLADSAAAASLARLLSASKTR